MSTNHDSVFSHMYSLPRNVGQFRPWSIQTFSVDNLDLGQFGPFGQFRFRPLVITNFNQWSIRTSTIGQFGL